VRPLLGKPKRSLPERMGKESPERGSC
jgi:hypothetical protein